MYELKELEERIVSVTEKQKTVAEKIISALEGEKLSLRESFVFLLRILFFLLIPLIHTSLITPLLLIYTDHTTVTNDISIF